jgi:hypothetical protein
MPEIVIKGMAELLAKLDRLGKPDVAKGAMLQAGAYVAGKMKEYPPTSHLTRKAVYGKSFASTRQRKFFFWAMKSGKLQSPYRRGQSPGSRNLKQGWTVRALGDGLTVEVGNNAPYGPLVQGAGRQSLYHKASGWQTDQAVVDREAPAVVAYVKDAIDKALAE